MLREIREYHPTKYVSYHTHGSGKLQESEGIQTLSSKHSIELGYSFIASLKLKYSEKAKKKNTQL